MADDPMMPLPAGKSAPCNRACRFAYPGEEAVYCQKHKMSGMVDVVNPSCKVRLDWLILLYDRATFFFCHIYTKYTAVFTSEQTRNMVQYI